MAAGLPCPPDVTEMRLQRSNMRAPHESSSSKTWMLGWGAIVFVTSVPINPVIVDYYLNLLPGIPHQHARRRLVLLSAHDG